MYWVNAAETRETFHWESGMRYQHSSSAYRLSVDPSGEPLLGQALDWALPRPHWADRAS